jgi:DNA-binding CsgD family transcriptional regulator
MGEMRGVARALSELGKEARMKDDDYARSIALLEESLALCLDLDDRATSAYTLLNLGISAWGIGDLPRAEDLLEQSLRLYREDGDLRHAAITQSMRGLVAWRAGRFECAATRFIDALEGHHRIGDWWFITYDLRGLAAVLVEWDNAESAARLLGAAQHLGETLGEVHSPIGGGTWGPLTERVQEGLSVDAFERCWAAGHALSRDEAVRAAVEAIEATSSNDQPFVPPSIIAHPDALTRREREVALLLAQGHSDRQISEELFIAVSTVGVHVHHILEKLDLRSRWQVADWVAASGLAQPDARLRAPDTPLDL